MAEGSRGQRGGVLGKLRQQSAELGKVAVTGTYNDKAAPAVGLLTLRRLQEHLKQQKGDIQNRIAADEISIDDKALEYITEDYLKEAAKKLHVDIDYVKVSHHNKSLALQRAQVYEVLHKKLKERSEESEVLKKRLKHSLGISTLLLKEGQETRALEKQLIEVQKKRMMLKQQSCEKMSELRSVVEEQHTQREPKQENVKRAYKYIKREMDRTTLLQNIFQRLVLASCVNWAEDPKLRAAVLKAGKDVSDL